MKTQLKDHLDQLNKAKAVVFCKPPYPPVGFDELRSLCDQILAACAPRPNSVVVMVVEEIVDKVSGLADIGKELKLVSWELRSAVLGPRATEVLVESAAQLDKLTNESNEDLRFLLWLLWNLVEEDA
jgi:hypothetical protein